MNGNNLKKFFSYLFSLVLILSSAYLPLKSGDVYAAAGTTTEISSVDAVIQNPIITGNEFTITYTINCFTNKTTASQLKNVSIQQSLPDSITYNSITSSPVGLVNGTPAFTAGSTGQKVIKINLNTIDLPASTDVGGTTTQKTITVKFQAGDIGKYDISEVKYAYDVADSAGKVVESGKNGSNNASISGLTIPASDVKLKVYPKIKVLYVHGVNEDSELVQPLIVHFKRPSWSSAGAKAGVKMYYYNGGGTLTGPSMMTNDGDGNYSYTLPKEWNNGKTRVIFENGDGTKKIPASGVAGTLVSNETWLDSDGKTKLKTQDNSKLDVDSMSIESFVSHTLMDINGNYDIVYFGKGVYIGKDDDRNTGKAVANYDTSSSKLLPGIKATVAPNYVLSNQTISSWDITKRMADKVQDFIATKQPVVFNNDVFASGTIFNARFGSLSFQDSTDIEQGYSTGSANVWKVGNIDSNTLVRMFAITGQHKPYMETEPNGKPDKTKCYSWAGSKNIVNYKVKCVNFNNNNPIAVTLCFDKNGDGVYSYNPSTGTANGEAVQVSRGLSGTEQTISFPMPSEYMGGQYWKLVAEDGTGQKSEDSDYFIYKGDKDTAEIDINVLQIMPTDNGSSLKSLFDKTDSEQRIDGTTPDGSTTGGTIGYWPGVFKITINAVTAADFQNNTGNCRDNLDKGKYDMLIFGFGDSYVKNMTFNDTSLTSIQKFIDKKRGVMFVHDTMSGIDGNRELKNAFLKPVGQIFQPTIYAGNFPSNRTDGKASGGYYYTDSSVERINTCGSWSCNYTDLMSKMRGIHTDMSSDNTNGVVKQKVSNVNAGIITTFPYQLDTLNTGTKAFNGASILNVSPTHIQYYRLNLEEADPWYNMCYDNCTTDPHGALDIDDSANTYYTYSIGNITFSGTGHNTAGYKDASDELKLFVNTVLKTYAGGNHSPGVQVISPTDSLKVPKAKNTIDFDFGISDYDGGALSVKAYIAKCPGSTLSDANRDISSLTDVDFTPVTINPSDIVIDRNGDGIADSKPDGISSTDGSMQAQSGDRIIIKDIPKDIDDILPGTLSRNFFLKVEVSDGMKTTTKIVPVINYDGPMLEIKPETDVTASMGADKTVAVAVYAKGTNRIPGPVIDKMENIYAGIQVFKADGKTPVTAEDVTVVPDTGDTDTVSTMKHKLSVLDPVIYHPYNVATGLIDDTLLSSPKAQADKDYEIWKYKLNFKKDGIYYVNYSTDYKVSGSDVTQNYTGSAQSTKITVVSKPSLPYIALNPSSLTYQNSNDDGSYPDDTDSPAVKLKIKFQLTAPITSVNDCKVVLKSAKGTSGAINNDFEITKATLVKTGGVVAVPTITGAISDKTISLGTLATTGNTEFYELTVEVKGKRLIDQNFCDARIAFSEFDYQKLDDASVTESISLDSPSADDIGHLPSPYYAGADNERDFTVYKVLNDQ